jgi:hypothetical protein
VNNAAVNIDVQTSVWISTVSSIGYTPRTETAGLYGNPTF